MKTFKELSAEAKSNAVVEYKASVNSRGSQYSDITLKEAWDLLNEHFDWLRFDEQGNQLKENN